MYNQLSEEQKQFRATWIGEGELKREYDISASFILSPGGSGEIRLTTYVIGEGTRTLYTIRDVPSSLEPGEILTGDGVRYMYQGGLYFNREDLKKLGIIP